MYSAVFYIIDILTNVCYLVNCKLYITRFLPGNVVNAVHHYRTISREIAEAAELIKKSPESVTNLAKEMRVPEELVLETVKLGRLPIVNFAAGGIGT